MTLSAEIQKRHTDQLNELGLLPGQDAFLQYLSENDGEIMGNVATALQISASSATKIAIKLEEAGLIRRESSRIDSRQIQAYLTEAGKKRLPDIAAIDEAIETQLIANFKTKDAERLQKLLLKMEAAIDGRSHKKLKRPAKPGKNSGKKKKNKNRH